MVQITLPDGSLREFPGPVTVADVAASIGAGLAKAALAGKVDGKVVDTSFTIAANSQLAIVTAKDADGLEVVRHSTAHLLAYAVKDLFPEAQVTIGPVIEHGFFYDFSYKRPFTPEDLAAIEKRMTELANKDEPVVRRVLPRLLEAGCRVVHLSGSNDHHEEGHHLPVQGAIDACKSDEGKVRGVEHQLDTHEHHDGVAPEQHSKCADAKQCSREVDVVHRVHLSSPSG